MLIAEQRYITETETRPGRFDLIGAVTATLGMSSLVFVIIDAAEVGWAPLKDPQFGRRGAVPAAPPKIGCPAWPARQKKPEIHH